MQYRNSITAQETCDQIGLKQTCLKNIYVYILLKSYSD